MTEMNGQPIRREYNTEPVHDDLTPVDADQSGALATGLMVAVVVIVALLTIALFISIP